MRIVCNRNDVGAHGWLSSVLQLHQANWLIDIERTNRVACVHREAQFTDPLQLLMPLSRSAHLTHEEEAFEVAFMASLLAPKLK